ncbi:MAG: nucleoside hydrolase [Eubacteriales bacterium]|nr:nucleoside hydrolase [Eubacteriales bacterium]
MTMKRKIIMDCDPGVDDAVALAFAAAHQEAFELLAITTVSGNQSIEKVTRNALNLVDFYKLDIPVARGMAEPITRVPVYAERTHGETGLGHCVLPVSSRCAEEEHAVMYLRNILSALPGNEKITLVATGPLTNLAMLLKLFPEVKGKIREIVFMGGAACGGNITPCAEFNSYTDPEAAKIVFHSGVPLVMCGLDATMKCTLTRRQVAKLCQSGDKVAKACGDMAGFSLENTSSKYRGEISIHDVVPYMYLIHPEIFTVKPAILDVDCSEGISRGATLCDFRWWKHEEGELDSFVLMDADKSKFQEYLITALYELGEALYGKKEGLDQ